MVDIIIILIVLVNIHYMLGTALDVRYAEGKTQLPFSRGSEAEH